MADPFLGEIRMMSFEHAPQGWALCNGQFLPINQNQALFALLGTNFGGNGQTTFALPDMRGRTPIHVADNHILGDRGGQQDHTLAPNELPQHIHLLNATSALADNANPSGNVLAATASKTYGAPSALAALNAAHVSNVGGTQSHTNMQPYLTINFCIALQGIFPTHS